MPADVVTALRRGGIVRGSCQPPVAAQPGDVPRCEAREPGYIVRFSDVMRMADDSVQVYVAAVRYATAASGALEALRFERAYQLVRQGSGWRVAREGRVPNGTEGR